MDYRVCRLRVELSRVGVLKSADVPCYLYDGYLHAEAYTEKRQFMLPRVPDSRDLAFNSPVAEAAGDEKAVDVFKERLRPLLLYVF